MTTPTLTLFAAAQGGADLRGPRRGPFVAHGGPAGGLT